MIRLRNSLLSTVVFALSSAFLTAAQTPANLSIISGNGQLACRGCPGVQLQSFEPMVVKVTDSTGSPVSSATVNWSAISPTALAVSLNSVQTTTAADGTTSNILNALFTSDRTAYTVVATLANSTASVTFTLTAGAPASSVSYAYAQVTSTLYTTITGSAGGTGSPPVQVQIQDFAGKGVSNISVRLIPAPDYTPGASVSCATGAGADVGSVLTDDNGLATCTPVFGPIPGTGTYHVLVGGVTSAQVNFVTGPIGYAEFASEFIQVSPGAPGLMKIISGNGQNSNAGQALSAPLVGEVDSSAGNPVSGASVTWSVAPAGAATLGSTTSTSDTNGRISNTVTLSSSATGTVLVTAMVSNSVFVTFSITVNTTVTGLSKVSGDVQTAIVGTAFPQPLVVQVAAANGQSAAGVTVQFAVSGPATSATSNVTTDSNGRASLTVTAAATPGAITVVASVGSFSVAFTLTAAPQGPAINPDSFVNGAGFFKTGILQSALSPCAIGTVIAPGIAPSIQGVVSSPMFGPLSYQLAQVTIAFGSSRAPLYNVANVNGQQQAAFQVPCDVTPASSTPVTVTVNGNSNTVNVPVRSAGPGVFTFNDTDGLQRAVIVRSDGSYAGANNPVRRGETVRVYITGLGQVQPALATNSVPLLATDSVALATVVVVSINNSGQRVILARRAPGLVGVDEIQFQVDPNAPAGNSVFYVAVYPNDNSGLEVSNTPWISVQ